MPELGGANVMQFYYIDLIDSVCRVIQDPTNVNKLYHAFEMQVDIDGNQMFHKANSELVFESIQLLDPTVSPILVIVASDAVIKAIPRHIPCIVSISSWLGKMHVVNRDVVQPPVFVTAALKRK